MSRVIVRVSDMGRHIYTVSLALFFQLLQGSVVQPPSMESKYASRLCSQKSYQSEFLYYSSSI